MENNRDCSIVSERPGAARHQFPVLEQPARRRDFEIAFISCSVIHQWQSMNMGQHCAACSSEAEAQNWDVKSSEKSSSWIG